MAFVDTGVARGDIFKLIEVCFFLFTTPCGWATLGGVAALFVGMHAWERWVPDRWKPRPPAAGGPANSPAADVAAAAGTDLADPTPVAPTAAAPGDLPGVVDGSGPPA
jgi:hypothetical protein